MGDDQSIYTDMNYTQCRHQQGMYCCTRPIGHEGEHWQVVVFASWGDPTVRDVGQVPDESANPHLKSRNTRKDWRQQSGFASLSDD